LVLRLGIREQAQTFETQFSSAEIASAAQFNRCESASPSAANLVSTPLGRRHLTGNAETLNVNLADRSYVIRFGSDLRRRSNQKSLA
jgi:hypothetical protein